MLRSGCCRGQSMQIGAILLFGFLVVALATAQAGLVPADISRAELDHSQRVADQLIALETAVFETSVTGRPQPTTLDLGPDYPDRLPFIYPPPAAGTFTTTTPATLAVDNAAAVTDTGSFDTYWNGTTRSYHTRAITYAPTYRELDSAPRYRIEHGVLAARHGTASRIEMAENRQPIVDDTEITLLAVDGELAATGIDTESVVVERVTESTPVDIEASGDPIRLRLPTQLSAAKWRNTILDGQPNVDSVTVTADVATVTLDPTETYELTIHKLTVGPNPTEPSAAYLRNASGGEYTFDVRTSYNDPVDDATTIWLYTDSDYDDPETSFTYLTQSQPQPTGERCYTLQKGVTDADAPETYEPAVGGCG